ncbi:MAG: hypothetical protein EBZ63_08410, partial [Burkholderiaceae bacterium]|nr:hypothetical protein [Burkholderiaceae bacterium]
MREPLAGAQWTGITTSIATQLLQKDLVDAVLTMAPDPDDRWRLKGFVLRVNKLTGSTTTLWVGGT